MSKEESGQRLDLGGQNERLKYPKMLAGQSLMCCQAQACCTGHNTPKLLQSSPAMLLPYLHQIGIQKLHLKDYKNNIPNLFKFLLFSLLNLSQIHL